MKTAREQPAEDYVIAKITLFGHTLKLTPALRDQILITTWVFVTFKQFRFDELILYPMALYFFWAFIRDFPQLIDMIARSLILWAFPFWWVLSTTWAVQPELVLRSGLQLLLTIMICYCAVLRLTPRQIMIAVLVAASWYGVLSFVEGLTSARPERGVFSSKNSLGTAMVILWLTALCSSLDTGLPRWFRLCAAGAALLGLYLIHVSNSATAVLLGLAGFLIVVFLWMRKLVTFFALVFLLVWVLAISATLGAVVAFAVPNFNPLEQLLGLFGKDTTLTGRTVLWQYAFDQIRQDPLLGVGVGGFWTPQDGFSTARRIYIDFHKEAHANFSFHNAFLEIAVHQGLIGLGLVLTSIAWCLWRITIAAIFDMSTPVTLFICLSLILLTRSLTEIGLLMPFSLLSMLFIMGGLFTLRQVYIPKQGEITSNPQIVS